MSKINLQDNPDNENRIAALRRERVGLAARAAAGDKKAEDNLGDLDRELSDRGFDGNLDDPDDAGGPATRPNTRLGRLSTGPDPRAGDPAVDEGAAENVKQPGKGEPEGKPDEAGDDKKTAKPKSDYPAPQGRSAKPGNAGNTSKG